jgi:hypothetical protein
MDMNIVETLFFAFKLKKMNVIINKNIIMGSSISFQTRLTKYREGNDIRSSVWVAVCKMVNHNGVWNQAHESSTWSMDDMNSLEAHVANKMLEEHPGCYTIIGFKNYFVMLFHDSVSTDRSVMASTLASEITQAYMEVQENKNSWSHVRPIFSCMIHDIDLAKLVNCTTWMMGEDQMFDAREEALRVVHWYNFMANTSNEEARIYKRNNSLETITIGLRLDNRSIGETVGTLYNFSVQDDLATEWETLPEYPFMKEHQE